VEKLHPRPGVTPIEYAAAGRECWGKPLRRKKGVMKLTNGVRE